MVALTKSIPTSPIQKVPAETWLWYYNPARHRWETYRMPADWPCDMYKWLNETFGPPLRVDKNSWWDHYGGHLYLYSEDYVTAFLLRWS